MSFKALAWGASLQYVCAVAGRPSSYTFIRFIVWRQIQLQGLMFFWVDPVSACAQQLSAYTQPCGVAIVLWHDDTGIKVPIALSHDATLSSS